MDIASLPTSFENEFVHALARFAVLGDVDVSPFDITFLGAKAGSVLVQSETAFGEHSVAQKFAVRLECCLDEILRTPSTFLATIDKVELAELLYTPEAIPEQSDRDSSDGFSSFLWVLIIGAVVVFLGLVGIGFLLRARQRYDDAKLAMESTRRPSTLRLKAPAGKVTHVHPLAIEAPSQPLAILDSAASSSNPVLQ